MLSRHKIKPIDYITTVNIDTVAIRTNNLCILSKLFGFVAEKYCSRSRAVKYTKKCLWQSCDCH